MPRAPRVHMPGAFYHVTLRGNHRERLFVAEGDQRLLNVIVARAMAASDARLHAYCWMTNHLHLLVQVDREPLARPMRSIASEFSRAMHKKLDTTGHFFENRYHASLVDTESYFLELVRYIHLNPVRAGIVARPGQYPWSSHHAYVGSRQESWLTTEFVLRMFGSDDVSAVLAYARFLDCADAAEWEPGITTTPASPRAEQPRSAPPTRFAEPATTLEDVIAEACRRFELTEERLVSRSRDLHASQVRAWIAIRAMDGRVCALSAVARRLGRHEATLREAVRLRRHDPE